MRRKEKYYTEEQKEVFKFFKILFVLVLIIALLYLFTVYVVNKEGKYTRTNTEGKIQYENIYLGTLLNRGDDEYYVIAYDLTNISNNLYRTAISEYKAKANHLPIYIADLSNELNKSFVNLEKSNKSDNIDELKFKGTTLVKVKNNKIVKFIETKDDILKEIK